MRFDLPLWLVYRTNNAFALRHAHVSVVVTRVTTVNRGEQEVHVLKPSTKVLTRGPAFCDALLVGPELTIENKHWSSKHGGVPFGVPLKPLQTRYSQKT